MHARFQPLPNRRHPHDTYETAAALRDRPGEWAHVDTHPNSNRASNQAHRIRTGKLAAFRPAGEFEATVRNNGEDVIYVYARYIGTDATL
ncbi:hypothetical protein AB0B50_04205 [Streptomyces sp. NPDC041068]|uniref:hypothetical protein n=1 Tax=Streptomyces sp. NPDC041068 TaxID=3155130 RepID=UPI0033CA5012